MAESESAAHHEQLSEAVQTLLDVIQAFQAEHSHFPIHVAIIGGLAVRRYIELHVSPA